LDFKAGPNWLENNYTDTFNRASTAAEKIRKKLELENSAEVVGVRNACKRLKNLNQQVQQINPNPSAEIDYKICRVDSYTKIDQVVKMQKSIESFLINELPFFLPKWNATKIPSSGMRFDAYQSNLAIANEVVCAFPFFLSYLRENRWGIIKYGEHKKVGVALKPNANNGELVRKLRDYNDRNKALVWLNDLLADEDLYGIEKIWSVEGYMNDEFLPIMVRQCNNQTLENAFVLKCRGMKGPNREGKFITDEYNKNVPDFFEKLNSGKAAIIYDLADEDEIKTLVGEENEFNFIPLLHGLSIPVGIGFIIRGNCISHSFIP